MRSILKDKNLNYDQTYKLQRMSKNKKKTIIKSRRVAPSNIGMASMPAYNKLRSQAVTRVGKNVKSFAGQAEDPFFLDLRVFDLLYGGDLSEAGDDTLAGFNVQSVALQVPQKWVAKNQNPKKNPVIGTWTTTSKKSANGKGYTQVSRLGNPLVNEVVIPLKLKDAFNGLKPTGDGAALKYVTNPGCRGYRGRLRHQGPRDPAQRPRVGVPHGCQGPQHAQGQDHSE